jgi:hypothetical protein
MEFFVHMLRVFYKHVLRRIFVPKRDEVTGGWREQHNEELHNVYSPAGIIRIMSRRMSWTGHVARMDEQGEEEEEECMPDVGGKARRKVTTRKKKTFVFE